MKCTNKKLSDLASDGEWKRRTQNHHQHISRCVVLWLAIMWRTGLRMYGPIAVYRGREGVRGTATTTAQIEKEKVKVLLLFIFIFFSLDVPLLHIHFSS